MINLINGDAIDEMHRLAKQNIIFDAVIVDLPYGLTNAKWDVPIDFKDMWNALNLITNKTTPIILFGQEPFSSKLRLSNLKYFKYDWYWIKSIVGNKLNAKKQPLRKIEIISVFYKRQCTYNPQGLVEYNKLSGSGYNTGLYGNVNEKKKYLQEYTNYPTNILNFKSLTNGKRYHSTQKPIALMEYLIKTYTNKNDLILDFAMGSGTTGVAALNLDRNFIGIEKNKDIFEIAKQRLDKQEKM